MEIKISLIKTFFRQAGGITLLALLTAVLFAVFYRQVLDWQNVWINSFILAHSLALALCFGRTRSQAFVYLYSRGYTRDTLWLNKMLALLLSILAVWLPASLMLWLGIRSRVQDILLSPYYPLVNIIEVNLPWFWLGGYLLLSSVFQYVWIRRAQPNRGSAGVVMLAIGMLVTIFTLMLFSSHKSWFINLTWIVSLIMIVTTLVGGLFLHRKMELK